MSQANPGKCLSFPPGGEATEEENERDEHYLPLPPALGILHLLMNFKNSLGCLTVLEILIWGNVFTLGEQSCHSG